MSVPARAARAARAAVEREDLEAIRRDALPLKGPESLDVLLDRIGDARYVLVIVPLGSDYAHASPRMRTVRDQSHPGVCADGTGVRGSHHAASAMECAMRVHMIKRAVEVLWDVPEDARKEIIMLITAAASAPPPTPGITAAAFGDSCWLEYITRGDAIEILDVGCLC